MVVEVGDVAFGDVSGIGLVLMGMFHPVNNLSVVEISAMLLFFTKQKLQNIPSTHPAT
jgi:hypothetical protein